MASPLVKTTVQACVMAASNYTINWTPVLQFTIFAALNTPPNFLWQSSLESTFPSHPLPPSNPPKQSAAGATNEKAPDNSKISQSALEPKLSIPNTLIKFTLDQSFGAAVNTVLFSLAMAGFRGATFQQAVWSAGEEFWPIMSAGWTLWPLVSAVNYTLIRSVEGRSLVGGVAGMGWGVYLSLISS